MSFGTKVLTIFAVLLCMAALSFLIMARRAEQQTEARFPPLGQFVDVSGQRIHAIVRGRGPDLVLIHGASSNARDFTFAFTDLLTQRYRVIVLDRPGFGFSDPAQNGPGSLEDQARILQAAASALGADSPIVLGHSYGGAVAMAWALHIPDTVSGVVIESGATMVWPTEVDRIYRILANPVGGPVVATAAAAFLGDDYIADAVTDTFAPLSAPDGFADYLGGALALRRTTLRINAAQRVALKPQIRTQSARYGEIDLPVEIVHGDMDGTVSLDIHGRGALEVLPNANLTVLKGVGHNPHNSVPNDVAAAVERVAKAAGLKP